MHLHGPYAIILGALHDGGEDWGTHLSRRSPSLRTRSASGAAFISSFLVWRLFFRVEFIVNNK